MNVVVAVPLDEQLASFIGKKGSENSITFYNRKLGSDVVVALLPGQEDEKVYALAESLLLCSEIVLSTSKIDRKFGEALVASSLLGKKVLVTNDNDVTALVKSAGIGGCRVVSREELLDAIVSGASAGASQEQVRVDIDKAFPVRGIGTVVLGVVTRGTLKQHDKLFHSSGKEVMVRSLQSQDEDITAAGRGTRIGISLKDIGDDEISKGDLLTSRPVGKSARIVVECRFSEVAKEKVGEGGLYGIAANFSYSECVVKKAEGGRLELALRAALPLEVGDNVLLVRKEVPRIFASGTVAEASA